MKEYDEKAAIAVSVIFVVGIISTVCAVAYTLAFMITESYL